MGTLGIWLVCKLWEVLGNLGSLKTLGTLRTLGTLGILELWDLWELWELSKTRTWIDQEVRKCKNGQNLGNWTRKKDIKSFRIRELKT